MAANGSNTSTIQIQNIQHLLKGEFLLYNKNKPLYEVSLTVTHIHCVPKDGTSKKGNISLAIKDIVGCDCMKGKTQDDPNSYLTIYAYPLKKKFASKKTHRHRQTLTITFSKHNRHDENEKDSMKWRDVIRCLVRRVPISPGQDLSTLSLPARKKILVLVNPFSGPGTALSLFQQRVVPVFAEAGLHYHMIVTEYAGHARSLMHSLQLADWGGVVIVSGDGLLFEVVNGLMEREDWAEAIKMPLGVLPGGSGNALCCALLHAAGESLTDSMLLHATFSLAKHEVLPMDLVAVETATGKKLYSFLAVAWGIISDVDIESEKYRSMGGARFTIGAVVRILKLRRYHGRLSFLPAGTFVPGPLTRSQSLVDPDPPRVVTQQPQRSQSMVGEIRMPEGAAVSPTTELGPIGEDTEDAEDKSSMADLVKVEVVMRDSGAAGDEGDQRPGFYVPTETSSEQPAAPGGGQPCPPHVETPLLNPLSEPVPDNWVTLDMRFIQVAATYQTHLARDFWVSSDCCLDDGLIHLAITRGDCNRRQVLQQFTDFQEGNIMDNPDVEVIKVKAFRLEPLTSPGHLTVDGELVDYGPIQGQVLPSLARVMSLPPPSNPSS